MTVDELISELETHSKAGRGEETVKIEIQDKDALDIDALFATQGKVYILPYTSYRNEEWR